MKTNLYAIYDSKAKIYNLPFGLQNDQVALRTATDLANDPASQTSRHPEDYTMFRIGTYDDETGTIETDETHIVITRFHEVIQEMNFGEESTTFDNMREQLKEA